MVPARRLVVAAVLRSEGLKDALSEVVAVAEKMRPPKNSEEDGDDDDDEVPAVAKEAEKPREKQAFILALVLYSAFHATHAKGVAAREDSAARIQAVARPGGEARFFARRAEGRGPEHPVGISAEI